MSLFYCTVCDNLRDSDDGANSTPNGLGLICAECVGEAETELDTLDINSDTWLTAVEEDESE